MLEFRIRFAVPFCASHAFPTFTNKKSRMGGCYVRNFGERTWNSLVQVYHHSSNQIRPWSRQDQIKCNSVGNTWCCAWPCAAPVPCAAPWNFRDIGERQTYRTSRGCGPNFQFAAGILDAVYVGASGVGCAKLSSEDSGELVGVDAP